MKTLKSAMKYLTPFVCLITLLTISNTLFSQNLTKEEIVEQQRLEEERGNYFGRHLCATIAPDYKQLEQDMGKYKSLEKNTGMTQLPMRIHIVRKTDGTGGISLDDINFEVSSLNYALYPQNIEYYIADVNYIDNSTYYTYDTSEETALCSPHQVNDAVNVFFVNSITTSSGNGACGYARFPSSSTLSLRILMANPCAGDEFNGTFVHEFGHHFSLYSHASRNFWR